MKELFFVGLVFLLVGCVVVEQDLSGALPVNSSVNCLLGVNDSINHTFSLWDECCPDGECVFVYYDIAYGRED